MSVGCSNFPVKVPKGFNYDAVERALEQNQPVSLADEGCYVALQLCIQDYRRMFALKDKLRKSPILSMVEMAVIQ